MDEAITNIGRRWNKLAEITRAMYANKDCKPSRTSKYGTNRYRVKPVLLYAVTVLDVLNATTHSTRAKPGATSAALENPGLTTVKSARLRFGIGWGK